MSEERGRESQQQYGGYEIRMALQAVVETWMEQYGVSRETAIYELQRLAVVAHKRNPSDPQISPRCGSHSLQMGRASDPHCVHMGPHLVQTAHKHPLRLTFAANNRTIEN